MILTFPARNRLSALHGSEGIREWLPEGPEAFGSPLTRRLWAWWAAASQEGLPRWQTFDVSDLPELVPHASLTVPRPDGSFLARIIGARMAQSLEPEREGARLTSDDPVENRRGLHDHYRWVVRHRRPLACRGPLTFAGRPDLRFEGLDVPLTRDGTTVSHILGVMAVRPPPAPA